MQRLFVVYNPRSSKFRHVRDEVLAHLPDCKGYLIGKYDIKKTNFDDNVNTIAKLLKDGDIIIAVGGDATAAMCVNAAILSGKDVALSALPYGNFNDFARTLGTKSLDDILSSQKITNYYPLELITDGKSRRYAACYITIGMTAAATEIFDKSKLRTKIKNSKLHSARSYLSLASWYFKNRYKKPYLSEHTINGVKESPKTSDYFAVNGRSAAGIMKGGEEYKSSKSFTSFSGKLTSFWRLAIFMAKSILVKTPGQTTTGDTIVFDGPTSVSVQAEGEIIPVDDCTTIEIKKSPRPLKVIQN